MNNMREREREVNVWLIQGMKYVWWMLTIKMDEEQRGCPLNGLQCDTHYTDPCDRYPTMSHTAIKRSTNIASGNDVEKENDMQFGNKQKVIYINYLQKWKRQQQIKNWQQL